MAIPAPGTWIADTAPNDPIIRDGVNYQLAITSGNTSATVTPAEKDLHEFSIGVTGNAQQATAGEIMVTLTLNGVTIHEAYVYVPSTSGNVPKLLDTGAIPLGDISYPVGGGDLVLTISSALTAGIVFCNSVFFG